MKDTSIPGATTGGLDLKPLDAEDLARIIRQLAIDLDQFLKRQDPAIGEIVRLRRRIRELRGHLGDLQKTEIDRWLRNVDHRLEAELVAVQNLDLSTS